MMNHYLQIILEFLYLGRVGLGTCNNGRRSIISKYEFFPSNLTYLSKSIGRHAVELGEGEVSQEQT